LSYSLLSHRSDFLGTNGGASGSLDTSGADLLCVAVITDVSSPTLSDSKSNTWSTIGNEYNSNGQKFLNIFFCQGGTVGTGHTFTVTGTAYNPVVAIGAWSGSGSSPLDAHTGDGTVFADSIQAGAGITPSVNGCLILSALLYSRTQSAAYPVDSGLAVIEFNEGGSVYLDIAWKAQASAAAINPTWGPPTFAGSVYIATATAAFKPASSTGSTGAAAGTSTATAVGASTKASAGSAAGTSTATGVSQVSNSSAGASAGTSTVDGVSRTGKNSVGAAAGTSTAAGFGGGGAASPGSAAGTSTALAVGASSGSSVGSTAGTSTATAVSETRKNSVGAAAGTSTATATGTTGGSTGSAAGTSTATAVGKSNRASVGSVVGSSIAAAVSGTIIFTSGTFLLANINLTETFEGHFTSRGWNSPQDQIDAGYPYFVEPTPTVGTYEETIDYGILLSSLIVTITYNQNQVTGSDTVLIEMKVSSDNITYTGYVSGATQFYPSFRYLRFKLTFTGATDKSILVISNLTIRLDVKREQDGGIISAVSSDAGGTTVTFNKGFKDIDSITATPMGTTDSKVIIDFVDAPNPTTFKVLLFNNTGTRISGDVRWAARGIV